MELKPDIIDAPLLKVPFESLKRVAKERKTLIDEAGEALDSLSTSGSKEEQLQQIDQLVSRLQGLKRKLTDVSQQEEGDAMRCKARLEHLQQLGAASKGSVVLWNKQRLDRLLVDHMLRSGNQASAGEELSDSASWGCVSGLCYWLLPGQHQYVQAVDMDILKAHSPCSCCRTHCYPTVQTAQQQLSTLSLLHNLIGAQQQLSALSLLHIPFLHVCAARLAQETGSAALSDMHIFAQAQRVIQSLKQHDCSAALAWCDANRARLKKAKSSLEFKLRLQEFLELVAKVRWGAGQTASNVSTRGKMVGVMQAHW
jgi:hypothetical protein